MHLFDQDILLTREKPNTYKTQISKNWSINGNPNGGYLMTAKQWSTSPEMRIDPTKKYQVIMDTTKGEIELELYPEHAPKTVNNFVFLAKEDFYDGILLKDRRS